MARRSCYDYMALSLEFDVTIAPRYDRPGDWLPCGKWKLLTLRLWSFSGRNFFIYLFSWMVSREYQRNHKAFHIVSSSCLIISRNNELKPLIPSGRKMAAWRVICWPIRKLHCSLWWLREMRNRGWFWVAIWTTLEKNNSECLENEMLISPSRIP